MPLLEELTVLFLGYGYKDFTPTELAHSTRTCLELLETLRLLRAGLSPFTFHLSPIPTRIEDEDEDEDDYGTPTPTPLPRTPQPPR